MRWESGNENKGDDVMKQIKSNKGFGLIECVISMFLICIALLGMSAHIGVSMAAMQTDKTASVASALLQDKAEAIRQTPFLNISTSGDSIIKGGISYTRSWNVSTSGNMKTVVLLISWNGRTSAETMLMTQ
jgi:prepilin-type N-terminal cleavage/methylation domain-containing protein